MGWQFEEGPDKGWSWIIVFAAFFTSLILPGISRTAGIFYVSFIEEFGVTREEASWPVVLFVSILNLSGIFTGPLAQRIGVRPVSIIGSIIAAIGMSCCYFTTSFRTITFLFGVIFGIGYGLVFTLVPVIVNQYFVNHRATANGIANSGSCFGAIILPLTFEYFLYNFGLSGCFLLTGGIILNLVVSSSFMRPPPWLQKPKIVSTAKSKIDCSNGKTVLPDTNDSISNRYYAGIRISEKKCSPESNFKDFQNNLNSVQHSTGCKYSGNSVTAGNNILIPKSSIKTFDKISNSKNGMSGMLESHVGNLRNENVKAYVGESENSHYFNGHFKIQNDVINIKNSSKISDLSTVKNNSSNAELSIAIDKRSCECELKNERNVKTILNSFRKVLRCRMFYVTTLTNFSFFLSYLTYCVIIVDFSLDKGVPDKDTKYVLFAFGISDLIGRVSFGWITDRKYLERSQYVMCCMIIIGLLFFCFPSVNGYVHLLIITSIYGLLVGCTMVVIPILLVDFLGIEIMPVAMGCMNFFNGIGTLIRPSLIGYFRDNIGSYLNLFYVLGSIVLFASSLWKIENFFAKTYEINKDKSVKSVK